MTTQAIDAAIKAAMLAKDTTRRDTLRMLKAAVSNKEIEKRSALEPAEILSVVSKEIKKRQDSVAAYKTGGREDLAAKEEAEIAILSELLPKALSPEEVDEIVKTAIAEAGATSRKQMGAVMKIASAKAAGAVDGKTLSTKVQALLPA